MTHRCYGKKGHLPGNLRIDARATRLRASCVVCVVSGMEWPFHSLVPVCRWIFEWTVCLTASFMRLSSSIRPHHFTFASLDFVDDILKHFP
ncbi:hypothetical protein E2C01_056658 [Portunus trituberculatus]|uniref:Uncharacterized protein n=1 Tax=Portunus trituberculatus TaxID=210409 RepID=A0A5B7GUQ9_PORTR|nr:hypothetical protein [Portunus trituberculatus]